MEENRSLLCPDLLTGFNILLPATEQVRGINVHCERILVALSDALLHTYFPLTLPEVDHFGRPGQKLLSTAFFMPRILLGSSKAHTQKFGSTLFICFSHTTYIMYFNRLSVLGYKDFFPASKTSKVPHDY